MTIQDFSHDWMYVSFVTTENEMYIGWMLFWWSVGHGLNRLLVQLNMRVM
jgi:hypothetical protein